MKNFDFGTYYALKVGIRKDDIQTTSFHDTDSESYHHHSLNVPSIRRLPAEQLKT